MLKMIFIMISLIIGKAEGLLISFLEGWTEPVTIRFIVNKEVSSNASFEARSALVVGRMILDIC